MQLPNRDMGNDMVMITISWILRLFLCTNINHYYEIKQSTGVRFKNAQGFFSSYLMCWLILALTLSLCKLLAPLSAEILRGPKPTFHPYIQGGYDLEQVVVK